MNYYKEHEKLLRNWLLNAQKKFPNAMFFKRDVGMFLTQNGRPIKIGINGQADVYGFIPYGYHTLWCEIEFKTLKAKQTKDQKKWEQNVSLKNGLYVVVRDCEQFAEIEDALNEKRLL